jgi:hypothetical protein
VVREVALPFTLSKQEAMGRRSQVRIMWTKLDFKFITLPGFWEQILGKGKARSLVWRPLQKSMENDI